MTRETAEREYELSKYSPYELIKELNDRGCDLTKIVATYTHLLKENGGERYYAPVVGYNPASDTYRLADGSHTDELGVPVTATEMYERSTHGA